MNDRPLSDEAAGFILRWSDMSDEAGHRRLLRGVDHRNAGERLGSSPTNALGARCLDVGCTGSDRRPWIATLDISDVMWPIKNGLYYLAATAGLAACLWFIQGKSGLHRRIGKVVMVLVWLACSAYVMEFLSWAA
jgi:hypothetical protein